MTVAYVGLGSNLDAPVSQVRQAVSALSRFPATALVRVSPLYRSPPMGPPDQPQFINAVAELDTALPPERLLDALQSQERRQGRVRGRHWGERTLDLDLLSWGDCAMRTSRLLLPHPGLADRDFVLLPWADIAPQYTIPGLGTVATVLAACPRRGATRLHDPALVESL